MFAVRSEQLLSQALVNLPKAWQMLQSKAEWARSKCMRCPADAAEDAGRSRCQRHALQSSGCQDRGPERSRLSLGAATPNGLFFLALVVCRIVFFY